MKLSNDPYALKVIIGLAVAGLLLFASSFNDPFHFDDVLVVKDSNVTNAARWSHFLNPLHLRQLTFFTFYLNYLLGGESPAGFHVVNVALHIANAVLLFCLLSRFTERWVAIAAAAIFLVHPIQTEPVLYIYQRSILLAGFFGLLGLIATADRRYWLAAVFFFCAFESKESALAIPLALAVLYWPRRKTAAALVLMIGVLAVAALGILSYRGESTVGFGALGQTSPMTYFLGQTRVFYTYLRLLIFPYPQSLEYEASVGLPVLQIAGICALLAIGWWLYRRERWHVFGLCIFAFFLLLAPTSSLIPSIDVAFEHRLYLPMLAFSVFAASVLARVPRRTLVAAVILPVLGIVTIARGAVWSSDIRLWEDTAQHAQGKARVWFNLGGAYLNTDNVKARAAFQRALELQPHFPEALYDLGVIEQAKNNIGGAFEYYREAVNQDPEYWPAWNNMGNTAFQLGDRNKAIDYLEKTLSLNPDYWPAQYNLAIVHFSSGRYEIAFRKLKTVLDWRPEFREARYLFAVSLSKAGYRNAAEEEWKKLGEPATERLNAPAMLAAPSRP